MAGGVLVAGRASGRWLSRLAVQVDVAGELATVRMGSGPVARWHDLAPFDLPGVRLGVDVTGRLLVLVAPPAQLHPDVLDGSAPGDFTLSDNMGYLYLAKRVRSARSVEVDVEDIGDFIVDVDREGRVVGIEFYEADGAPPGWTRAR